jgi:2-dehydro-3-deoxyphosphogluconate aldolase / (4S)-4-hydroxy-2-oxoglutarate aldolase
MEQQHTATLQAILRRVPVVPVLTIDDDTDAVGLARALAAGGLTILEVTLRTPSALAAIRAMVNAVPGIVVGAGTVLSPDQGVKAIHSGAKFLVSPGITPALAQAAARWPVPFLPGIATASEAMALRDLGYRTLKFFPAEPAGGVAALKGLAGPLPDLMFCPTGGIDAAKAPSYLALPTVITVGGSWVAPANLVAAGGWPAITALAAATARLR